MPSGDELAETADTGSAQPPSSGQPPRSGDTIGRYVIERVLGAGGMGVVYAAHDPDLDRRVALKLLHEGGAGPEARTRLLREARAMAKISHANVITVYEVGTAAGVDFVAMELIEGTNLATWLRTSTRPAAAVLPVFRAAGRGLAAAHATGLVHRDFKPANVLLGTGGKVVVTDFGLARAFDDGGGTSPSMPGRPSDDVATAPLAGPATRPARVDALDETHEAAPTPAPPSTRSPRTDSADLSSTITRTGTLLGTPAYMAPEQFAGDVAGPKADQYAFAVALWEGLAGARPFRGTSFDELKQAVERGTAVDGERIPRRLRAVIARGLARDPAARWRDVDELLAALDRAERRPRQLAIAAAAVTVAGGLAALVAFGPGRDRTTAPPAVVCGITDADFDEAWSAPIAARIDAHFAGDPAWKTHQGDIDRFAASWRAERADACSDPSKREYHGRIGCLLAVRDELSAITTLAESLPIEAMRGAAIAEILSDPTSCRSGVAAARPRLPDDPAERAALSAIYRDSSIATMAARAGDAPRARAAAAAAVERARAGDNALGVAAALHAAAVVEHISGDCAKAEPLYAETAIAAERAQAGGVRAMAKIGELECFMGRSSDLDAIRALADQTEAAVDGAGGDRNLRAVFDMNLAAIDALAGDLDTAIERVAGSRQVFLEANDPRRVSSAADREATLRSFRNAPGDGARALELVRDAAAAAVAKFGPEHPISRDARVRLAYELLAREPDQARAMFAALAATRPPPSADDPPRDTSARAFGRVLGPDGAPAAGARVNAGLFLLCSDDGVPLPIDMIEAQPPVIVVTDADGRFDVKVPREAVVVADLGDLRAPVAVAGDRELTLRLGPALGASGTITVIPASPPPGSERATALAARATRPDALVIGSGAAFLYQCASRRDDAGNWSIHGLPADRRLRVGVAVTTGLGDRLVVSEPVRAEASPRPIALTLDLRGAALDVIVRADRAAPIPTAGVFLFGARLAPLPRNGVEMRDAVGAVSRSSVANAAPVVDATRTGAGAALYQPGDIHARFAAFAPGPVTVCVMPLAGDVRDDTFMRSLWGADDLDVRCRVIEVAAAPAVQAFVVETPPMRRLGP